MSTGPSAASGRADMDPQMEEGAIVKIHSLQSEAAKKHNGAHAQLGVFNQDTGRWQAKLRRGKTLSGVEISVKFANLSFVRASWCLDDAQRTFKDCNSLLFKLQDLSAACDWKGLVALEDNATQMARMEEGLNVENAAAIYYNLALAHTNLLNYNKAIWFHEQDLAMARRVGDSVWIAQAVCNIANARDPSASQEISVEHLEDFERMQEEKGIENFTVFDIVNYAICLRDKGLHKRVIEILEPRLESVKNASGRKREGIACGILSCAYLAEQHYNKAIKVGDRRLLIAKETFDKCGESAALCNLGACYTQLGQYEKALNYLDQDLGIARELGDVGGEGTTLGNMGNNFYAQGRIAMAADTFLASQRCAQEAGHHDVALKASMLRGQALCSPSTWTECVEVFTDCIGVAHRLGDKESVGKACQLLGHTYLEYYCVETGGSTICDEDGSANPPEATQSRSQIKIVLQLAQRWSLASLDSATQNLGVALDLARQGYLLGDENAAISMLQLYLKLCVSRGRHANKHLHVCDFCSQSRGEDAPMETCGGCRVARYCSREHQKLAHNNSSKNLRWDTFPHKILCPLWKRWKNVEEGNESADDCRQDLLKFLDKINTLTSDGKTREVGGMGWGGNVSFPLSSRIALYHPDQVPYAIALPQATPQLQNSHDTHKKH